MTSSKRRREVARAKAERQAHRRAEAAQGRRARNRILAVAAVVVIAAGAVTWAVINRPSSSPDAAAPSPSASPSDSTATANPADCSSAPPTRPDDLTWPQAPEDALQPGTAYTITLDTNCGDIAIATLPDAAPATVNSIAFLTAEGFYDLTPCHRLTTEGIYVLQCGDPAGTGRGGPGYAIPDENLPAEGEANYPAGTVAMANAGPGTSGSQFFIVYEDTTLPSGYTIWGEVVTGLDVVRGIAAAGVEGGGADGPPAQPVVIEKATLTTSPAN